jgi:hypothetical protein
MMADNAFEVNGKKKGGFTNVANTFSVTSSPK